MELATVSSRIANRNKLFAQTQLRLAMWYASAMGVILSLCGVGIYEAIAHAHWTTLEAELETVAGTLHDSIEPTLQQPGELESQTRQLLPSICLVGANCATSERTTQRHHTGATSQGDYYVRLLNNSGAVIAIVGSPPPAIPNRISLAKQLLRNSAGDRYQQISLTLHTQDYRPWGYIQVGRSFADFDNYLAVVRWILLLGLPVAMFLVAVASWWLAKRAMQPVYLSYQQIQQFSADVAHELRTPLAAIQATVESTLRADRLSLKEASDTLQVIERQNYRLSQLVQDLLLLSRMEQQDLLVKRTAPVCLNDLISDIGEELATLAIAAHVTLTTKIAASKPVYVLGDEEQIYRLLANLTSNAIQYTLPGGEVTVILDSSDGSAKNAVIQVIDSGVGIAPPEQKRIFDRFYRVNSDRARSTGGSGLGLSIAKAIAIAHQGSIQVESQLGKGSIFTIYLPYKQGTN